ncbi:MAG: DUF4040 domain-containing protein [Prochlorotrichaceae cyanobacterium]
MSDGIMTDDFYVVAIVFLLPVMAGLLVFQSNPYQALVIRGILGAIAALVYALFGAADVALTEALVGTMLSITLYAVAVRSSMNMRLGLFDPEHITPQDLAQSEPHQGIKIDVALKDHGFQAEPWPLENYPTPYQIVLKTLRNCLLPHHLHLEIVLYSTIEALKLALENKEVQTICIAPSLALDALPEEELPECHLHTRLWRLYEILQGGIPPTIATLTYQEAPPAAESNIPKSETPESKIAEAS